MLSFHEMLLQFHHHFGLPIGQSWNIPERHALRTELLREEFYEYLNAEEQRDPVAIADALADILYVVWGTAVEYGIPLDNVFRAVHNSNMTKIWPDGTVKKRDDGKVIKPPDWKAPPIFKILIDKAHPSLVVHLLKHKT